MTARHLRGGKKLGLDLDRIASSMNHRQRLAEVQETLHYLRLELCRAEREGRYSKAKKIRRAINGELEVELYLRHSWCGGCKNVLHNCICKAG